MRLTLPRGSPARCARLVCVLVSLAPTAVGAGFGLLNFLAVVVIAGRGGKHLQRVEAHEVGDQPVGQTACEQLTAFATAQALERPDHQRRPYRLRLVSVRHGAQSARATSSGTVHKPAATAAPRQPSRRRHPNRSDAASWSRTSNAGT
jgi:hypothetical protein